MNSTIEIEDLEIRCIVGIYPHEREQEQTLFVSVTMRHDVQAAAHAQEIAKTVNYAAVAEALDEWVRAQKALLLEFLAVGACDLVLAKWPTVQAVRVKVMKPAAIDAARYAAVTFERERM